ncbi:MAG: hypothetical protein H5T69_07940, partial [Chloroflexi bacterium]|nr:hypothetical protein [Chloroflexota bacterium]
MSFTQAGPAKPIVRSRRARAHVEWLVALVIVVAATTWLMTNWLSGQGLPTSHRRESLTDLTITWMFRQ